MTQLELFPLNLIERVARHTEARMLDELLLKIQDAYGQYVEHQGNYMYADHVVFTDGDTPVFTIEREFYPDLCSDYMNEAHPTMYDRIVEVHYR